MLQFLHPHNRINQKEFNSIKIGIHIESYINPSPTWEAHFRCLSHSELHAGIGSQGQSGSEYHTGDVSVTTVMVRIHYVHTI